MNWKICLSDVDYGEEEQECVAAVLRSKWLSMGDVTKQFEARFAEYLGVKHAFLVSNCTAALHMANLAVGVGPGDEVIVPSLTFVATANATVYCGATPVFADIVGPEDLNISPDDIRARITPRTKAITVVHYGGYPANMDAIMAIARDNGLAVIEDAAHAPGATWNGRMVGSIGNVGCFSFFSNKNIVTGEGGAIVTDDDQIAEELRLLRSHGMTSLSYDRHKGHAFSYDVVRVGYNYRATEITAALACAQLKKLSASNRRRQELTLLYRDHLRDIHEVSIPFLDHPGSSAFHLMPVLLAEGIHREEVMTSLRQDGIQTSIHYPPVHQFTGYRGSADTFRQGLPVTDAICRRQLTLPLHPLMSDDQVRQVANSLSKTLPVELS